MDTFLTQWLLLVAIFSVVVVSPGPDFVMALQNSLNYGRRAGIMTAIGFGFGVIVHVAYTLAGLAVLIAHSVVLFSTIKYIGAAYLFYVGVKALRSSGWKDQVATTGENLQKKSDLGSIRDGFITNVLNPKATLFFLALFTQLLTHEMTFLHKFTLGGTCVIMVTAWFTGVAVFMTVPAIRAWFSRISKWLDRVCGVIFIALGLKLAAARL